MMLWWLPLLAADAPASPGGNPLAEPIGLPSRGYVAPRADEPPTIDGRLDDPAWLAAPWSDEFVDIEGDAKPKPTWRTRMKLVWDDQCLYVGAELEEPNVWATLTEHDSVIFWDHDFEVFIDPDGDNHQYYEFEMNALNTTWDLRLVKPYRDGGPALNEWEIPGLRTAVHIDGTLNDPRDTDRGWSLEIAFPWAALAEFAGRPTPPLPGDQWRINCSRVEWDVEVIDGVTRKIAGRPEHNWVWSPQGLVDMHRPERWGTVQFATTAAEPLLPDPAAGVRDLLHRVYYAQHRHRAAHGTWSADLASLAGVDLTCARLSAPPTLTPTPAGWQARATIHLPHGGRQTWVIREDSRIWAEG